MNSLTSDRDPGSTTATVPSTAAEAGASARAHGLSGQVVLVLQGGGALGAYQIGVYEALHEAGIEPDWVIGTSIGAINGALIAGNAPEHRIERLVSFWQALQRGGGEGPYADFLNGATSWLDAWGLGSAMANFATVTRGVPTFFEPNRAALQGSRARLGVEGAAYYSTAPLRRSLAALVDFDYLAGRHTRLTVGAVNACTGVMRYFDSRDEVLCVDHIMASGALPPAFGAVRIDGQPYWDGGIYSNTPIEAVLDDKPRRDSLIFAVNVWHQSGPEPDSIWQVLSRQKDIQFASRADSHIARQKQIHRLRHVIRQLTMLLPPQQRDDARIKALSAYGCSTTMHVAHLIAPRLATEDHLKDIDFTPAGVRARRQAGYADTLRMIERSPWKLPADPLEGVVECR